MNKWIFILIAFIFFCSSKIYITWHLNIWNYLYLIAIFCCLCYSFFYRNTDKRNYSYVISFIVLYGWYSIHYGSNVAGVLFNTFVPLLLLTSLDLRLKLLEFIILRILPVTLVVSITTYILVHLHVIDLPTFIVSPLNAIKDYSYVSHIFFIEPIDSWGINRFHAIYDEPGVIGSLSGLLLCLYGKKMDRFSMLIYIISGVLSMSLFFFVITIFGFMFGMITTKIKEGFKLMIIILPIILFLMSLFDNDFIQSRIFDRFTIDETGGFKGNNRNNDNFEYYFYNTFIYNISDFLFGSNKYSYLIEGSSSIHVAIYRHGFILVMLIILSYISFIFKYASSIRQSVLFIIVFLGMMYQRPELVNMFYFFLFTTIAEASIIKK